MKRFILFLFLFLCCLCSIVLILVLIAPQFLPSLYDRITHQIIPMRDDPSVQIDPLSIPADATNGKMSDTASDTAKVRPAQTTQQIAQQAFRSTVLLLMEDANGQPFSLGSGFFVAPDQIATNLHVVEGARSGFSKLIGKETKYDIQGYTAIDEKRDLIILKVNKTETPRLTFADSDLVMVGDPIYVVGNPIGLEGTFSQGIISSIRPIGTDKVIQLTAPISPGSSGGPVLNNRGQVIGVSVATFKGGQNLNFAIPANYLKTLIAQVSTPKPLPKRNDRKTNALMDTLGDRGAEGVSGNKFLWDNTYSGNYSFSIRNRLRSSVTNVYCLVIFYDVHGDPIDVDVVRTRKEIGFGDIKIPESDVIIPSGLAKRIKSKVDDSIQELTTRSLSNTPYTKVEFRILDYEILK